MIVAGKQPALDYLTMDEAVAHCTRGLGSGLGVQRRRPAARRVSPAPANPTLEELAATAILRERLPDLKVRVINIVDLMRLQPEG